MIYQQLVQQIQSMVGLLDSLNKEQYTKKIKHLGDASIGEHTRHIIELLKCVTTSYEFNKVDYINRTRNTKFEIDKQLALEELKELKKQIFLEDKELQLVVESDATIVMTTYYRELVYNTEHMIHHLALIKVALLEMNLDIVDPDFGMAYSTIQYKASLAKA